MMTQPAAVRALMWALVFVSGTIWAAQPPACTPIASLTTPSQGMAGPVEIAEQTPLRIGGRKGTAYSRSYRSPAEIDFVIKSPDGTLCSFRFSEPLITLDEFKAVSLRRGTDSLLVVAHPSMATGDFHALYWLLMFNPGTGRWTGLYLDRHPGMSVVLPVESKLNWDDPEAAPERRYLEKLKVDYDKR